MEMSFLKNCLTMYFSILCEVRINKGSSPFQSGPEGKVFTCITHVSLSLRALPSFLPPLSAPPGEGAAGRAGGCEMTRATAGREQRALGHRGTNQVCGWPAATLLTP